MPERYKGIKRSIRERYPDAPESEIKERSSKIFNATRPEGGKTIQEYAAEEKPKRHSRVTTNRDR